MSFIWMPAVGLFECGLKFGGRMGGLEPSSNQAGSGEQFKRGEKYISPGGMSVPKTVLSGTLRCDLFVVGVESFSSIRSRRFLEHDTQSAR